VRRQVSTAKETFPDSSRISFRLPSVIAVAAQRAARAQGFSSVSHYVRHLVERDTKAVQHQILDLEGMKQIMLANHLQLSEQVVRHETVLRAILALQESSTKAFLGLLPDSLPEPVSENDGLRRSMRRWNMIQKNAAQLNGQALDEIASSFERRLLAKKGAQAVQK
jgi:uncharacterized protein (DUF1778 family)